MVKIEENLFCLERGSGWDLVRICNGKTRVLFKAETLEECYEHYLNHVVT